MQTLLLTTLDVPTLLPITFFFNKGRIALGIYSLSSLLASTCSRLSRDFGCKRTANWKRVRKICDWMVIFTGLTEQITNGDGLQPDYFGACLFHCFLGKLCPSVSTSMDGRENLEIENVITDACCSISRFCLYLSLVGYLHKIN